MKYIGKGISDQYLKFATNDTQFIGGVRTNTELQVRTVNRHGRDERQVAIQVMTHHQKSNRLVTAHDSFDMTPKEALLLAFAVSPELKEMIGDLIFGTDNDLIQPMIDRCNKIVDVVGRETFDAASEIR